MSDYAAIRAHAKANPVSWEEFLTLLRQRGMAFAYPSYPCNCYTITCSCDWHTRFGIGASSSYMAATAAAHVCPTEKGTTNDQ